MPKFTPTPSRDYLLKHLTYDRFTGFFRWTQYAKDLSKGKSGKRKTDDVLGADGDPSDYVKIRLGGQTHLAHRLAWKIETGEDSEFIIDHKDTVRSHNWFNNLREATKLQNLGNRPARTESGVKGVRFNERTKLWNLVITRSYKTFEEAAIASEQYYSSRYGDFNFIPSNDNERNTA